MPGRFGNERITTQEPGSQARHSPQRSAEKPANARKARMERILERVSSESRAAPPPPLSFREAVGRDSMYENVDAGYETTEHKVRRVRNDHRLNPLKDLAILINFNFLVRQY